MWTVDSAYWNAGVDLYKEWTEISFAFSQGDTKLKINDVILIFYLLCSK